MEALEDSSMCRLCLKNVDNNLIEITKEIEDLFYELTQSRLKILSSNLACQECLINLNQCIVIKRNFITTQIQFETGIKQEKQDPIDSEDIFNENNFDVGFKEENLNSFESNMITGEFSISNYEKTSQSSRHGKKRGKSQCTDCGKMVFNLHKHHIQNHSKIKLYFCDLCDYSCHFKKQIIPHLQTHLIEKDFKCALCGKTFSTKFLLGRHQQAIHDKITNYTCSICGKSFFYLKSWSLHEKRHFERQEKCSECGKLFFGQMDLRRHIKLVHTAPDIECKYPDCGRKFHLNRDLKLHIKTRHENLRPFSCKHCQMTFKASGSLHRHINSIHKARRCACAIPDCSFSFSRKDKYKKHILARHKFIDQEGLESLLHNVKFE